MKRFEFIEGERESGKKEFERIILLNSIKKQLEESPYVWDGMPNTVYDDGKYIIFRCKKD